MNPLYFNLNLRTAVSVGSLIVATAPSAVAQSPRLEELAPDSGWFVRLGGFVRTGAKLSLKDRSVATPSLGNPVAGFNYDNGFVKPDAGGSDHDTYNWGYTGALPESYTATPQYVAGGDSLTFQRIDNAPRVGDVDLGNQSLYGGELTGGFEISSFKIGAREVRWGFELGYSYSTLSSSASAQAQSANTVLTTHVYSLVDENGRYVPPQAPFTGSAIGPNFLLTRIFNGIDSAVSAGTATLDATMDASVHTLRVGPWFQFPLTRRISLGLSLGYAATLADTELQLSESTTYTGNDIVGRNFTLETFRRSAWVPGAFAQLRATYMFTEHVGIFVGGEVQWTQNLHFAARSREADLRFGAMFGGVVGLNLSF